MQVNKEINTIMKKLLLLVCLIGSLIFGVLGQMGYITNGNFTAIVTNGNKIIDSDISILKSDRATVSINKMEDETCSSTVEGLKLCTSTPIIATKLGEKIIFQLTLKNVSSDKVSVPNLGNFNSLYRTSVTTPSGGILKTKQSVLEEKVVSGNATNEEAGDVLAFGSVRTDINKILEPGENVSFTYDLSKFFDFAEKGTYHLTIARILGQALSDTPQKSVNSNFSNLELKKIKIQVN